MRFSSRLRASGLPIGKFFFRFFQKIKNSEKRFNLTGLEENVPSELWTKYEPHYYRGMRMIAGLKDHQYTAGTANLVGVFSFC